MLIFLASAITRDSPKVTETDAIKIHHKGHSCDILQSYSRTSCELKTANSIKIGRP